MAIGRLESYNGFAALAMPYRHTPRCSLLAGTILAFSCVLAQSQPTTSPTADRKQIDHKARAAQGKRRNSPTTPSVSDARRSWLDEDVRWIISDEERKAFDLLRRDEEKDLFIEQFWRRRDPTPDTVMNEYKEEHYRRMLYANERFAGASPGWETDQGHIYILYGPPDGLAPAPQSDTSSTVAAYPAEVWRYRYIEGVGENVVILFADTCRCGELRVVSYSVAGKMASDPTALFQPFWPYRRESELIHHDLEIHVGGVKAPQVRFKDLEDFVTHKITVHMVPFEVRTDFVKITSDTDLAVITVEVKNKDITLVDEGGEQRGTLNIFGRFTTMAGRIAETFEDILLVPPRSGDAAVSQVDGTTVYARRLPLQAGRYRLDLAVRDVKGDRVGTWGGEMAVPTLGEGQVVTSSLILSSGMASVARTTDLWSGFVLGGTKLMPRVAALGGMPVFSRGEQLNLWAQVYNLGIDGTTLKPNASVEYDIRKTGAKAAFIHSIETTGALEHAGQQVTLKKAWPLADFVPGVYQVTVKVQDKIGKQAAIQTASFAVE